MTGLPEFRSEPLRVAVLREDCPKCSRTFRLDVYGRDFDNANQNLTFLVRDHEKRDHPGPASGGAQ